MMRAQAFSLAVLLLIALHSVSCSSNTPVETAQVVPAATTAKPPSTGGKAKAAIQTTVQGTTAQSTVAATVQQYDGEDGGDYSKSEDAGGDSGSYDIYQEQQYQESTPYAGLGEPEEKQNDEYKEQKSSPAEDSYENTPGSYEAGGEEPEQQAYGGGDGPDSKQYNAEGPEEEPYPSGPQKPDLLCPKAMSADAVGKVYQGHGDAVWKDLALQNAPVKRGKRGSQASAVPKPGPAARGAAVQAAKGAAAAAAHQKDGASHLPKVGIAGIPRTQALARPQKATAQKAKAAYMDAKAAGKREPGLSDPEFLLPVDLEIAGKGAEGTFSGELIPTDEALAVGPYPDNPSFVTILHSVNAVAEILTASKKTGERIPNRTPTKVSLAQLAIQARSQADIGHLTMGDPTAFYDCKDERWVLIWSSFSDSPSVTPSLFVAVSYTIDPLGKWRVYSLEARPTITVGYKFCEKGGSYFSPLAPQSTFSHDGIFVSIGASCSSSQKGEETAIMSTLYAYSKAALYDVSTSSPNILAATYMGPMSWKSSISHKEQSLVKEDYRTFNNLITPARPQAPEDVDEEPLFVMKVDGAYMSVATLTDDPLSKMTGIDNAPSIRAIVVGKGEDFSNKEGLPDGNAIMPQPDTDVVLDSGDTGMLGGKYGIRAYGTVHHKGMLYTTMSEFFGVENMRIPSIYWGIISTHPGSGLCKAARKKWGFISSQDGLALAYPVIAARHDGSALVVFSYSGMAELPHSLGPAYPGVASAVVGVKRGYGATPHIVIVRLGRAAIEQTSDDLSKDDLVARWGDYSAMQVFEGQMWYAVPIAEALLDNEDYRQAWRSWVGVEEL